MTAVTKEDFKKNIIAFFKKETGLTIAQAKAKIKESYFVDKYGNNHNNDMKAGNVKLFYTNNANYGNGKKNGWGKGWYIGNSGFTGGNTIKLSENF